MERFARQLRIELPPRQSAFLWGPRKVGKSTFLKTRFPDSLVYDFLDTDLFIELAKRPALLREQLIAADPKLLLHPVILDEVQKVPQILDEVHWLIENRAVRFVLCGSSARKLKRGRVNLLGGRAWRFEMFPLTSFELTSFKLLDVLNRGLVPMHFQQERHFRRSLKAYTRDYLKQEVFDEGLARNIPAFSRFFDAVGYSHGELTNYSNIARDCGVDSKTVREYYQILVDTLLGTMIEPYKRTQDRQTISRAPKFYLFDVGVAGALVNRQLTEPRGEQFGKAFEHFILMELLAHRSYRELDYDINFWRTKSGNEVDFVLERGRVALEVKGTSRVDNREFRSLLKFIEDYAPKKAILVCNEPRERLFRSIRVMPYRKFLSELWSDKILS